MNRRELLREMSRVQARWVNSNTPGTGDVDIAVEDEQAYLTRISEVFERARQDVRRKRTRAMAATRVIDELMAGFDRDQPRDRKGKWTDRADAAPAPKADPEPPARKTAPPRARKATGDTPAKKPAPAKAKASASGWLSEAATGKLTAKSEKAIRDVFAFKDPDTGMSSEVSSVTATPGGRVQMTINIRDTEGRVVGTAVRTLSPPKGKGDTRPQMYHTSFFLGKRAQGGGFSSRWLRQMEDRYREAGVGSIGLTTNDVGGYAWAKAGFDFDGRDEVSQMGNRFKRALGTKANQRDLPQRVITDGMELHRRSQSKNKADWPTPMEFAMLGWTPGADTWFGKEQMLGTAWKGVKKL